MGGECDKQRTLHNHFSMEALASISGLRAIHSPPSAVPSTSTPSYTKLVPAKPGSSPGTCARSHPFQSPSRPSEPTPPDRLGERSGPACAKGAAPPVVPYNSVHTPPPTSKTEPSGSGSGNGSGRSSKVCCSPTAGKVAPSWVPSWVWSRFRSRFWGVYCPGPVYHGVRSSSAAATGVTVQVLFRIGGGRGSLGV